MRSNSDPSENTRKWSVSATGHRQEDLLWFQLGAHPKNTYSATVTVTDRNRQRSVMSQQQQIHPETEHNVNTKDFAMKSNGMNMKPKRASKRGRNKTTAADIRIDPHRRRFYLFLWLLAVALNAISYLDAKHSLFWDGCLIMFIHIVFKKFDHLLVAVINPLYRRCCRCYCCRKHIERAPKSEDYRRVGSGSINKHNAQRNVGGGDMEMGNHANVSIQNTAKLKHDENGLKQPLMMEMRMMEHHAAMKGAKILREGNEDEDERKDEEAADADSADSGSADSGSDASSDSDSMDVYGPGDFADGAFAADHIFGVQMNFTSLHTIPQSQPLYCN